MSVPDVAERVRRATAQVGGGAGFTGRCEVFVRTCFGFPAMYASARRAWEDTERRHADVDAPAGVPVYWDILSGVNVDFDHIALSVGGGFCVSTSAGPGRTVAKVGIDDLTRRWGMVYRGWSEDYHRVLVHTASSRGMSVGDRWPDVDLRVRDAHTSESTRAWRLLMASIGFDDDDLDLAMQRWLRARGLYDGLLDGDFAEKSVTALQTFLKAKGLYPFPIDGDRGPDTVQGEIRYLNQQRLFF